VHNAFLDFNLQVSRKRRFILVFRAAYKLGAPYCPPMMMAAGFSKLGASAKGASVS
jgi:hypothetical protein